MAAPDMTVSPYSPIPGNRADPTGRRSDPPALSGRECPVRGTRSGEQSMAGSVSSGVVLSVLLSVNPDCSPLREQSWRPFKSCHHVW